MITFINFVLGGVFYIFSTQREIEFSYYWSLIINTFVFQFNLWILIGFMDIRNTFYLIGIIPLVLIILFAPSKTEERGIPAIIIGFFILMLSIVMYTPTFTLNTQNISFPVGTKISQQWILNSNGKKMNLPKNCEPLKLIHSNENFQFIYQTILPKTINIDLNGRLDGSFEEEIYFQGEVDLVCGLTSRFYLGNIMINSTKNMEPLPFILNNEFENEIQWTPDLFFYGYCFLIILFIFNENQNQ